MTGMTVYAQGDMAEWGRGAKNRINKTQKKLEVGETYQLKLIGVKGNVKWSSSKASVASVKAGKVIAKKIGKTTISAKVGNKKYVCSITVRKSSCDAAYRKYLKNHKNIKYYKMIDINADGVKELLCADKYYASDHTPLIKNTPGFKVYTYADKKVLNAGTITSGYAQVVFSCNKKGIILDIATGYGACSYKCCYYTLNNRQKLKEQTLTSMCGYYWVTESDIEEYSVNDQKVSKKIYKKYYDRFHKNSQVLTFSKNRF